MSGEGGDLTPCAHSWPQREEDSSSLARTLPMKSHEPFTIALQLPFPLYKSVLLSLLWGVLHVACHGFRPRIAMLLVISNKPIFAGTIYVSLFISGQQRLGKRLGCLPLSSLEDTVLNSPIRMHFLPGHPKFMVIGYWISSVSWLMAKDCWDLSSWQENTPVKLVSSINTMHGA